MIKVLIVEDHQILADGIKSLLVHQEGIQVIGDAPDGKLAIEFLEEHEVDVALVDIEMPVLNGLDLTKKIKEVYSDTKVIILSMHKKAQYINAAIEFGADGYILKDNADKDEIVGAIKEVAKGGMHFGSEVVNIQFKSQREKLKWEKERVTLTKREKEVLNLVADGLTTEEISKRLFIATSTVDTHRKHLIEKMGVANSIQLVRKAGEEGYLES